MTINPLPVASFTTTGPYCANQNIVVKDASGITSGAITTWSWTMGVGLHLYRQDECQSYLHGIKGQFMPGLTTQFT